MGCPIDSYSFDEAVLEITSRIEDGNSTNLVHFLNVAKVVKAQKDSCLHAALWDGDLVLADGKPLLPAAQGLGITLPTRVNGTDLMEKLLEVCEKRHYKIYLFGAKQEVIEDCVRNIRKTYPNIQFAGYRNGYYAKNEIDGIIENINESHPDILFVGLGTPQKELFAYRYRNKFRVPIIQGAGGNFDVIAGFVKRAPKWMQIYGLEWLYRLLQEPRRLFWRYLSTNCKFMMIYAKQFLWRHKNNNKQ